MDEMNYNEQVLKAVQIVVQGEIRKVHFDQTIKATIIGDESADEGRYWCSNGFSEFWAYSTEVRYRKNDKVLVTIPEGDYSNSTKVIISKQADENNSPLILASPLAMMVDLTNNMVTGEIEEVTWANLGRENNQPDCKYSWDIDTKDFINSAAFQYGIPFYDSGINKIYETDITRLGFSAQFSTWLTEYTAISGNYGIAIELTFKDNDREGVVNNYTELTSQPIVSEIYFKNQTSTGTNKVELTPEERAALFDIFTTDAKKRSRIGWATDSNNTNQKIPTGQYKLDGENFVTVYKYAPSNEFVKYITFDSEEFFGDIYGYDTYYTNEVVFDVSDFSKYAIIRIRAWLYQRDNFRAMDGEYIEAPFAGDFSNINPNIFMKDPYLCLGVETSEFISDKVELITSSSSTFYKTLKSPDPEVENDTSEKRRLRENLKKIHLRWIHKDENTGIIRLVEEDEYPEDYEIRWYRWALGKPSCDEFSGAHWERFYGCKDTPNQEGDYAITLDEISALNEQGDIWSRNPTNQLDAQLSPNINRSQEKIKAIILKVEQPVLTSYVREGDTITANPVNGDIIYRFAGETKELVFTNDDEVRNEQTYIDMNALSIRFDDGSNGHYFLYNRAGNVSKDSDLEIRTLTLVFDETKTETDVYNKPTVPASVPIVWHFPESMTMITPATTAGLDGKPTDVHTFTNTVSVGYFIKKSLSRQDNNNTVTAEAIIDGVTYSAAVQMSFGTAGTSGSDYTLDIVWNNNALDVTNPKTGLLIGQVGLYDSAGNQILGDSETITDLTSDYELKYEWEVAELIDDDAGYDYPYEEYGVLYPIFSDSADATFDQSGEFVTGVSNNNTYGGYYYFIETDNSLINKFNAMCGTTVLNSKTEIADNLNTDTIKTNLKLSTETLAFYDLDQEKFIYLKDYFQDVNKLNLTDITDKLFNEQLYRKRDVENLRVIKSIKNEHFYKDLIHVFVKNGDLLYTNLLSDLSQINIQNIIDTYEVRLKSAAEIGSTSFNNFYFNKEVEKEEIMETVESTGSTSTKVKLVTTEIITIPYSQYLQSIFEENEVTEDNFAEITSSIKLGIFKEDDVYIDFNNLTSDVKERFYETLFNALFETNNFYYNYLLNKKDSLTFQLISTWEDEKEKYFYAQKIGQKLKYIFQYIAAASNIKSRLYNSDFYEKTSDSRIYTNKIYYNKSGSTYIEVSSPSLNNLSDYYEKINLFGSPGEEIYVCSQISKNGNDINETLITSDSNQEFSYEWPKPKIDYKAIQNIEGMEEDLDIDFEPKYFTSGEASRVWKTKGNFISKTDAFYKQLAEQISSQNGLDSYITLTNYIDNLNNYSSDIETRTEGESIDIDLNYQKKNSGNSFQSFVSTYLRPDNADNTIESILDRLLQFKANSGNNSDNWVTEGYNWRYGNNDVSGEELYSYLLKAIFKNSREMLNDDVLIALNNASSYLKEAQDFDKANSNLVKYFIKTTNNDLTILESIYHYLTYGVNSKDKQKELYENVKDTILGNLVSYKSETLNNQIFLDGNLNSNFYRVLADRCGIFNNLYTNEEEPVFASDRLTFYSAFNRSIPIDINSREEQLKYISNIFCTHPNQEDDNYYRLANYLNLDDVNLADVLAYYYKDSTLGENEEENLHNCLIESAIDANFNLDKKLLDFLNTAFDVNKNTLTLQEKHNFISTIFSATTSSVINNYISDGVIKTKSEVQGSNEAAAIANVLCVTGSLSLNTTTGTIISDGEIEGIITSIKTAASSSDYLNYFVTVNKCYKAGYNASVWYNIVNNISNEDKWILLYLLLCSTNNFPQTANNVPDYLEDYSTITLGSNTQINLCFNNNSSTPLYFLNSNSQSSMPASLQQTYNNSSTYQTIINNINNNSSGNIYIFESEETSGSSTIYKFTQKCSKADYIAFLKANLFKQIISETLFTLNDNSRNYNLTNTNYQALCKYIITSGNYINHLKTEKDSIGVFPSSSTPFTITNYSNLITKIPLIQYNVENKYDNFSTYLSKSVVVNGSTHSISQNLITALSNKLNNSNIVFVQEITPNKEDYVEKCFNLLIQSEQNTNSTTVLSESLVSLDNFITAFHLNENRDINSSLKNNKTISNFNIVNTCEIYQLINEDNQEYQNIFKTLKNDLKNNNINPVTYNDDSLALKGWQERMYETVRSFYNNFDISNDNLIKLNEPTLAVAQTLNPHLDSNDFDFYPQIYSILFGVTDSSNYQRYTFNNDLYEYKITENNRTRGPVINYILLLNKYVFTTIINNENVDNNVSNMITKKVLTSIPNDTNLVYIKDNNEFKCLNSLLKLSGSGTNKTVTDNSLKAVYLLLENATEYYKTANANNKLSKSEAYQYIFNTVLQINNSSYTDENKDTYRWLLNIFQIDSTMDSDLSSEVSYTSVGLLNAYYYGEQINVDFPENILYNINTELGKCFNNQGKFTNAGKNKFFELLAQLENNNTYIYELTTNTNSVNFNIDNLIIACKALWGIKDSDLDNNYIDICKAKINNTISFYQSFKSDYYNNIKTHLSQYLGRNDETTQELAEFFKGSNNDDEGITISNMVNGYDTIKKDSFFLLLDGSENSDLNNGDNVFNYQNTKNLRPFIKINDNYIIDPYYKDSSDQKVYKGYRSDETYYYPAQRNKEKGKTIPLVYSPKGEKGRIVWISPNQSLAIADDGIKKLMSSLSVLKVTLSNFGDYDLVAYFPIAVKQGTTYYNDLSIKFTPGYLQGATYIRYTAFGETDFEKNPYRMFSKEMNEEENGKHTKVSYQDLRLVNNKDNFGWKIIHPEPEAYISANFIPSLKESQGIEIPSGVNLKQLPILQPITVYIPEAVPYGVSCYYNNNVTHNGSSTIPIWTQAIYCYEDNYPSTTINKWDGKTILTDDESGTIVSSALAAGKKESDNTFTGVMMGDWSRSDTDPAIAAHTGLFGFNHGSMAYAFKDDGTGFIGKDGRGRIVFDGHKSQIYSNNWKGTDQCGMFLDIDDGVIKLQSEKMNDDTIPVGIGSDGKVIESSKGLPSKEGQRYITISSKASTYPLAIGIDSSPSQRKFRVKWNGSAYLTDAYLNNVYAKGYIYATGGVFEGDITSEHGTISGPTITGGDITCKRLVAEERGLIAGWTIATNGLINGDHSTVLSTNTQDLILTDENGEEYKIDNPFAASIVTNRIVLASEGLNTSTKQVMYVGYVTGQAKLLQEDGLSILSNTDAMGISGPSRLIFETSNDGASANGFAMGIKTPNGMMILEGKRTNRIQLGSKIVDPKTQVETEGLYFEAGAIQFNISAEKQYGIYARFA